MTGRALPHRPRRAVRRRAGAAVPWTSSACALVLALAVGLAPLPAEPVGLAATASAAGGVPDEVVVRDPVPPPGAVLPAGPVVVAARVEGAEDRVVRLTLDGEPVRGRAADPDGPLTALSGVEVPLEAGVHELAVLVDDRPVRRWHVVVTGLSAAVAREPALELAERLGAAGPGPVVAFDRSQPALALAVPVLVAALDGTPLPHAPGLDPAQAAQAAGLADGRPVLAVGGPGVPGPRVTALPGTTPAAVAASATRHLGDRVRATLVAPAEPFAAALRGAAEAARIGAGLLLVDGPAPDEATTAVLAGADAVLLSAELSADQRRAVVDRVPAGVAVSDDDVRPGAALEAVVVPDGVDRTRALVAVAAADAGRPVLVGTDAAAGWTAASRPGRVTVVDPVPPPPSGTVVADPLLPELATTPALDPTAPAVETVAPPAGLVVRGAGDVVDALHRAWADGVGGADGRPGPPAVGATVQGGDGLDVTLTADRPVSDAGVHVTVHGYEWPGEVRVDGTGVRWVGGPRPPLPLALEPQGEGTALPVQVVTAVTAGGATRHQAFRSVVGVDAADAVSPEGWVVAGGVEAAVGDLDARHVTYTVEVEPETGLDLHAVEAEVSRILSDPRSWTADGSVRLQRIGAPALARVRVVVARPSTVDAYCGAVGLRTGGSASCWDGRRAMLNLARWQGGVSPFHLDLTVYRQYLVNHEVGHGLGHGHERCAGPGRLAPVMQQQTGGLGVCRANGWPYPDAG
jgi:hypothetical protein